MAHLEEHRWRDSEALAWGFHRGTSRWLFNTAGSESPPLRPSREHAVAPFVPLPSGGPPEGTPDALAAAIGRRVSCRRFSDAAVPLGDVARLLRLAYGVGRHHAGGPQGMYDRPVPSGGGLYPLEVNLLVRAVDGLVPGVHHFVPTADGVELVREGALPPSLLTYLFMGQPWVPEAAFVVVLSAVPGRSLEKYGDRGYRYLLLEAGHLMQNLNLVGWSLGIGSVNLGGFFDDELAGLLRLDTEQEFCLYASAFGIPDADPTDPMALRALERSN